MTLRAVAALVAGVLTAGAVLFALGGPASGGGTGPPTARADAQANGRAVFARMGCGGCHRLAEGGGSGGVGPALDTRLASYDAASLRAKIVDPYPVGDPMYFSAMPRDYGRRLSAGELEALVAFLLATTRR